jgi:catechol 2,3-dioxygenase-like lactoylglutathione lyase family enzyme
MKRASAIRWTVLPRWTFDGPPQARCVEPPRSGNDRAAGRIGARRESEGCSVRPCDDPGVEPCGVGALAAANDERPPTRRLHIGFLAPSRDHVDEFWRVGTAAGFREDGAPGPRPEYSEDYYGAFLLDPDGNNIEVVNHNRG